MVNGMRVNSASFGNDLLALVNSVVPLSGSCFYRVDDGRHVSDHTLHGLSERWLGEYYRRFWRMDPLHPTRVRTADQRIAFLQPDDANEQESLDYIRGFLAPQSTPYQTEIYFRACGRIVAGVSILRDFAQGPMDEGHRRFLEHVAAFVDQAIAPDVARPGDLAAVGLTAREEEIAQLIARGLCNKQICRVLSIELPTVKTHVARIFRKMEVTSRAQLMKKLYWGH